MIGNTDLRIIQLMIEKTDRILEITKKYSEEEIKKEYILSDALQYEFEKLYEDSTRLSLVFKLDHEWLHIDDLRSIRNRVAHNYASVIMDILISTAKNDISKLRDDLIKVTEEDKK